MQVVMKISMPPGLGTDTPFSQQQASTDVWDAGPDQFAQEPIFCPRPDAQTEDDGCVFTMVYDSVSDCSHLAVLDAKNLKSGPVARIKLPQRIPYGKNWYFPPSNIPLPSVICLVLSCDCSTLIWC
jgi:carotenoid cleavage dioxygenase-like enzyme